MVVISVNNISQTEESKCSTTFQFTLDTQNQVIMLFELFSVRNIIVPFLN